jgi:putative ABC transport system permease protein
MSAADTLRFALRALTASRLRLALMLLAMGTGVLAVAALTALGEGARRYVVGQFQTLGTHLLIVLPGRAETAGGAPPMLGSTARDLTLEDALALARSPAIAELAPVTIGVAPVSRGARSRDVRVLGSTAALTRVRDVAVARGQFLPDGDPRAPAPVAVLGAQLAAELFGTANPLGEWVRAEDRRFRVVGVLADKGRAFDLDWNDMLIVPIASAQALFDTQAVFRVLVSARSPAAIGRARADILRIVAERHQGEDDVTVLTQDAILATFNRILRALTLGLAAIAAVSLTVAGVLVMNVMLVAVAQRTAEVGLLKALGASRATVPRLFLTEAVVLSALAALAGAAAGVAVVAVARQVFPAFPAATPSWALGGGVAMALLAGLVFGLLPARRAARLDPVAALAGRR